MGVTALVVIGVLVSPSEEEKAKELTATLGKMAEAQAAHISPTGELAATFKLDSKYTDIQREKAEKEITGKIIQWTLPVYEVNKRGNGYRVQTSGNDAIMGGTPRVGAFITIYPRNDNDRTHIENLKTGDNITFKGEITGTSMRNIEIEPAILVSR